MSEQLALDILNDDPVEPVAEEEVDLAESVLTAHGGDALAAIRSLLEDADFLRDQLYIASNLMSRGISRGWRPQYERLS
jgi:hypothetical protein